MITAETPGTLRFRNFLLFADPRGISFAFQRGREGEKQKEFIKLYILLILPLMNEFENIPTEWQTEQTLQRIVE